MLNLLKTGRYMICGKPALCLVNADGVRVHFDDGNYTAFFYETFLRWAPFPIGDAH